MLIDTHLHLDAAEFNADRAWVIRAAQAAGVGRFVLPSVEIANCTVVRDLAQTLPGSVCAFGIHPLYVTQASEDDIPRLRRLLAEGSASAVGEIGLDAFEDESDTERQEWFFVEQLKLARAFDLPVLLHIRRAQDRVLKYLRQIPVRGGIAHAFNGSQQQAQAFIDLGFKLGFGGAMTYAGSTRIRALAANLPLDAIVLESDAPDMPPAWASQTRNEPMNVARYAQLLAELRGVDYASIAEATSANARSALGLQAD
ncbi:TatD family hydrolase [Uliginosibacterium flavum]